MPRTSLFDRLERIDKIADPVDKARRTFREVASGFRKSFKKNVLEAKEVGCLDEAIMILKEARKSRQFRGGPDNLDPAWKWVEYADKRWPSFKLQIYFDAMVGRILIGPPHLSKVRGSGSPTDLTLILELLTHIDKFPDQLPPDPERYRIIVDVPNMCQSPAELEIAYLKFAVRHLRWSIENGVRLESIRKLANRLNNVDLNRKLRVLSPSFKDLPIDLSAVRIKVKRVRDRAYAKTYRKANRDRKSRRMN